MHVLAHDLAAERGGLELVVVAHGGEHAGDGDGLDALFFHLEEELLRSFRVEGGEMLAVVLKAAAYDGAADGDPADVLSPVHHGRYAERGGRAYAEDADGREVLALDDGVGALGGAEHGLLYLAAVHA